MVVREGTILGSGSGHCSAMVNGTKDLTRTRLWKDTQSPGFLKDGVGPAPWGTPEALFTSEPPSGGSELFLDTRWVNVTRVGTLAWSPGESPKQDPECL